MLLAFQKINLIRRSFIMGKVLIIGCGGVAPAIHKCCQNSEVFEEIALQAAPNPNATRSRKTRGHYQKPKITTAQVDANNVDELIALINEVKPDVVLNLALPYQDLTIMDALPPATKTHYVDTANYEPEDTAKFEYSWQWAYRERFEQAGITALLGSGFDPRRYQAYSPLTLSNMNLTRSTTSTSSTATAATTAIRSQPTSTLKSNIREVSAKRFLLGRRSLGRDRTNGNQT